MSKLTFDKDIPHAQLPLVMPIYQVSETINQSEHVDLHPDGTSRDQKRIIGEQLNCSEYGVLSTGWSSVASADSTKHNCNV